MFANRIFGIAAAISGASGVALSAAAAHLGGGNIGTAATFLLFHAPAFLFASGVKIGRIAQAGAFLLLAGVALFSGDLLMRHFLEMRLFPMAAPAGGLGMIGGWVLLGGGVALGRQRDG